MTILAGHKFAFRDTLQHAPAIDHCRFTIAMDFCSQELAIPLIVGATTAMVRSLFPKSNLSPDPSTDYAMVVAVAVGIAVTAAAAIT